MLTNVVGLTLEFTCPRPQDVFSVDIVKSIGQSLISLSETFFRYFMLYFIYSENEIMFFFFP